MASNEENVSIWWRHHVFKTLAGDVPGNKSQGINSDDIDLVIPDLFPFQHLEEALREWMSHYTSSWIFQAMKFEFMIFQSIWNLTGITSAMLLCHLSNTIVILISISNLMAPRVCESLQTQLKVEIKAKGGCQQTPIIAPCTGLLILVLHGYPGVKLPRTPQSWYPWQQGNYFIWLYVWIVWIWVSMIAWWINECL